MNSTFHPILGKDVKLGALSPRAADKAKYPKLNRYLSAALPPPPRSKAWGTKVALFPMFRNDIYGDCTAAAAGHMEQIWSSNTGTLWTPTDAEVESMYWNTGDGKDTGRYLTDTLTYWNQTGLGQRQDKISAYAQVNVKDHNHVKTAVYLFGGVYIGLGLPITAQSQSLWSVVPDDGSGKSNFGSWGGHAVNITAYTSRYLTCITWGMRLRMTWSFWDKYVDEAWAILSPDWANGTITPPNGFSLAELQADLSQVS